ncbi:MAG: right-handed parallel beta-helix repeat-containing protein [Breznakibacter sp.]
MITTRGLIMAGTMMVSGCSVNGFARSVSVSTVQELQAAVKSVQPGDTIWIKGGEYQLTARVNLLASGTADKKICLFAVDTEKQRPVFDGSGMEVKSSNQAFKLQASYWHIKGLDVTGAGDNGMWVTAASNNTIENCRFFGNNDSGIQIDGGSSNNLVLNCDSYSNVDPKVENADGFACKMDVGGGNRFVGCRAWNNLDDGWDGYLRGTDNVSTSYENCWAFRNGMKADGTPTGGDGNGFKTGGSDTKLLKHNAVYVNCIAAANVADGFDHNSNRGTVTLTACKAYLNKNNFNFSDKMPVEKLVVKQCSVIGKAGKLLGETVDIEGNSWQSGTGLAESDVKSVDVAELMKPRTKDGSLPEISFMTRK